MTKMVVFADSSESETGRLIYLRKPEKLILRIEGRTPNDDPATFRIKLGGSFIASTERAADEGPSLARQDPNEPGVKVNSVGTIVAVIPKPAPPKPEPVAKSEPPASAGGQSPTGKAAGSKPEPRAKKAESPPSAAGKTAKIEPSTRTSGKSADRSRYGEYQTTANRNDCQSDVVEKETQSSGREGRGACAKERQNRKNETTDKDTDGRAARSAR